MIMLVPTRETFILYDKEREKFLAEFREIEEKTEDDDAMESAFDRLCTKWTSNVI